MEISRFVFDKMIDVPVVQERAGFSRAGRLHPCREAEAASHGLFLVGKVIDVPVVQVEQVPLVPSWRRQPSSVCRPFHAA